MDELLCMAGNLRKGELKDTVDRRLEEFKALGKRGEDELFKELCFCLLTANYSAEGGMRIQNAVGDGFLTLPEEELATRLRELGHRFPDKRAEYIVGARKHVKELTKVLEKSGPEARVWLDKNVKGLGYKEASHFLRNVGFEDLAIVDFHIVDILVKHDLVQRPKAMTPKRYLEIESVLRKLGGRAGMSMAELDLYLWYCETGKVLK